MPIQAGITKNDAGNRHENDRDLRLAVESYRSAPRGGKHSHCETPGFLRLCQKFEIKLKVFDNEPTQQKSFLHLKLI